ncbi:MAG: acyl-CoA dehydrogenase [Epsilonproteobacteria bacterium]|nr:MAG: acyl-CoA dehydrogenase [Campylobacterota bacterium]RLA65983.1 MAG: acyl-CoA dehydrogenase [Campylobacterota bacterium]
MNFELTDDQKELQKMARDFSEGELAPKAPEWDEKKIFPKDVLKTAGELGFLSIYTPEDFGGIGLGRLDAAIIFEELAGGCTSTAAYMTIHNMVNWMIATWAKTDLAQKYCPDLGSGSLLGSYCLTEPGTGSDAAALKTTAVLKGDKYIVNGAKAFVSGGGETDVLVVMVRTGEAGPKGISTLLIPADLPGIEYGKNEEKMGWNSQPTKIINFVNVEVPAENLMGAEGEGFKIAMKGLDGGRINIGTCSIGAAQKCLTLAQKYMHEREAFGKPLAKFQALQFKLADMATGLVAARQMIRLAAYKLDQDDPNKTTYCAMAKKFATDEGFKICNDSIQLFGGYGYTKEYQVERFMRDARVHQILEGTNEIMNVIISRKILQAGGTEEIR